jgi:hypothetical protein
MTEPRQPDNRRKIQRMRDDYAETFNPLVREGGLTHLTYQGSVYELPGSVFNALVLQQAAERMAAGRKYPAIVAIPRSLLRRT